MGKTLENSMAEKEANDIAFKFMNSNDVVKDMSAAYNVDFSGVNFHSDASADSKVKAEGKDAIASGNDIFFGKGILESNDAASKGLVAHELVHTMQQGVVESSGVVSQSVSEGAEQGGKFTDFFKKLFGKKKEDIEISEPTAMGVASDQDSLDYMAAMRARDKELALDDEKFRQKIIAMKAGMPDLVKKSDSMYESHKNDEGMTDILLTSYALQGLGHRTSKDDADIRKDFMGRMRNKYMRNWETIDAKGIDYKQANSGYNMMNNGNLQYLYNDYTNQITGDILNIIGEGLESDRAKMYKYEFLNGVKDAKIFGKTLPIDYFFSTVFTGEGARLGEARNNAFGVKFTQQGVDYERGEVFKNASKNLAILPAISNMSEDERKVLSPSLKSLFEQYKILCKKIEEQVANYKPQ